MVVGSRVTFVTQLNPNAIRNVIFLTRWKRNAPIHLRSSTSSHQNAADPKRGQSRGHMECGSSLPLCPLVLRPNLETLSSHSAPSMPHRGSGSLPLNVCKARSATSFPLLHNLPPTKTPLTKARPIPRTYGVRVLAPALSLHPSPQPRNSPSHSAAPMTHRGRRPGTVLVTLNGRPGGARRRRAWVERGEQGVPERGYKSVRRQPGVSYGEIARFARSSLSFIMHAGPFGLRRPRWRSVE